MYRELNRLEPETHDRPCVGCNDLTEHVLCPFCAVAVAVAGHHAMVCHCPFCELRALVVLALWSRGESTNVERLDEVSEAYVSEEARVARLEEEVSAMVDRTKVRDLLVFLNGGMAPTVVILRGAPGAGKTRLAKALQPERSARFSADHYFEGEGGAYVFDPAKIGEAHRMCAYHFSCALRASASTAAFPLVVDNTSMSAAEVSPYELFAGAYGHDVLVVTLKVPVETCLARQAHGAPETLVRAIAAGIDDTAAIPAWWKHLELDEADLAAALAVLEVGT